MCSTGKSLSYLIFDDGTMASQSSYLLPLRPSVATSYAELLETILCEKGPQEVLDETADGAFQNTCVDTSTCLTSVHYSGLTLHLSHDELRSTNTSTYVA